VMSVIEKKFNASLIVCVCRFAYMYIQTSKGAKKERKKENDGRK